MQNGGRAVIVAAVVLAAGCFQEEAPRRDAPVAMAMETAAPSAVAARAAAAIEESEPTVSELAETVRNAENPVARREAVYAIADAGDDSAAALVGEALTDPEAEIRIAAIEALTGFEGTASADWLSIGLGDPDPRVRRTAVEALGEIGGDSARLLLQQALGDVDPGVRETAAQMLSEPAFARGSVR